MSSAPTSGRAPEPAPSPRADAWDRARVAAAFGLPADTMARLDAYVALLERWQARVNLIGPATVGDIWGRHIADSLQLIALAPADARVWLDLGSGAGLPGLVLAIALAGRPGFAMHLVEANARKCAFLAIAGAAAGVPVTVHRARIEALGREAGHPRPEIICARALAPLSELLPLARPFMWKRTVLLLHKGQDVERELTEATISRKLTIERRASVVDPAATILRIREASDR